MNFGKSRLPKMTTHQFCKCRLQNLSLNVRFIDPYSFGFLGTQELKNEHAIEDKLTEHVVEFLMEMGRGFAFVGRQYRIMVDGDEICSY